jgi:hypothetical protein
VRVDEFESVSSKSILTQRRHDATKGKTRKRNKRLLRFSLRRRLEAPTSGAPSREAGGNGSLSNVDVK